MRPRIDDHAAVRALVESAEFAAGILDEVQQSRRLGVGSIAGQTIEARNRLLASAALVREADPQFRAHDVKTRVLRALGLDDSAWSAGSMHAYGATCFVRIPAETIPDGLAIIEKLNPVNAFNSEEYPATYLPQKAYDAKKEVRTILDASPYQGKLSGLIGRRAEFHLICFVETKDGDTVRVDVPCKNFSPITRSYETVKFRGGYRLENVQANGWLTYFKRVHKMWSTPDQPNEFIFVA